MKIVLPQPTISGSTSLDQALGNRRSCREYSTAALDQQQLAQLLWAAQGASGNNGQRTAPSAGAQYPVEIYALAGRVEQLPMGTYRYRSSARELERVVDGDTRDRLGDAALDEQPWVQQAALILVLTADFESVQVHFNEQPPRGKRGERYIYLESGAIAQNIGLQATALDLGAVIVGGFDDAAVIAALDLPRGRRPTTLICIGVGEAVSG